VAPNAAPASPNAAPAVVGDVGNASSVSGITARARDDRRRAPMNLA
jgi:hypothetical protein